MQWTEKLSEQVDKMRKFGKEKLNISDDAAGRAKRRIWIQGGITLAAFLIVIGVVFGLTAAWYNNIVQTNTIVLSAKNWDFTGQITLGTEDPEHAGQILPIQAEPGEDGIFPISITNADAGAIRVRIDVSKTGVTEDSTKPPMAEQLQKRLYAYYLDYPAGEGEPTKVYLNSLSHKVYANIPANSTLTLGADENGDPLVKIGDSVQASLDGTPAAEAVIRWEWVYDVLGAFCVGTYNGDISGSFDPTNLTVTEYLEPVVYDYDTAEFAASGALNKVTPAGGSAQYAADYVNAIRSDFLQRTGLSALSTTYAVTNPSNGDYYLVFARYGSENSFIFLYLAGKNTIQAELVTDTGLGTGTVTIPAAERQFTFHFTGENVQ